jgi:hypothetical protein
VVLAQDRALAVGGELGAALPGGGLRRGTVTSVHGPGAAAAALPLLAAVTGVGEWAAVVELADRPGDFAGLAAVESGVVLDHCAIIRSVQRERWAVVVGALLEGMTMVAASVPAHARPADARRLVARARERQALLIVVGAGWPAEAALRIHAGPSRWHGLERGDGLLAWRDLAITVEGKGAPRRAHLDLAARAG